MKFATKIGFAAAAVALIAMLGAASASASALTETVLCKEVKQAPYCKSSERYPKGTAISASPGFPAETVTIEGAVEVTCSASTITGTTSAEAGEPLPVSISAWSLGGCKTSKGTSCTVTALERAPYSGSLSRKSGSDGTMSVASGGKGNPGWNVKCGFVLNCSWTLEPGFTYQGWSSHAEMIASKLPLSRVSGFCPEKATFTGTYIVNSPWGAPLAIPKEAPTKPATALCKSLDIYCEPGDLYKSGTVLKAPIAEPVFEANKSYTYGNFTCSSGELQVETTADYGLESYPGGPLLITTALKSLSGCSSKGTSCTISTWEPGEHAIAVLPLTGDGSFTDASSVSMSIFIKCGSRVCVIGSGPGEATLVHGEPARIEGTLGWEAVEEEGGPCPTSLKLSLGEEGVALSSPSSVLVVTDALR